MPTDARLPDPAWVPNVNEDMRTATTGCIAREDPVSRSMTTLAKDSARGEDGSSSTKTSSPSHIHRSRFSVRCRN